MLDMNEALLGAPNVPRLSFKPSDVAISEGSHVAVVISFKATFSLPLDRAPRTPGLWPCVFHLAEAAMVLPAALHKFLARKRTFVTFLV